MISTLEATEDSGTTTFLYLSRVFLYCSSISLNSYDTVLHKQFRKRSQHTSPKVLQKKFFCFFKGYCFSIRNFSSVSTSKTFLKTVTQPFHCIFRCKSFSKISIQILCCQILIRFLWRIKLIRFMKQKTPRVFFFFSKRVFLQF